MEEIVTLSKEHLNLKNLVVVTSEENRMFVKCKLNCYNYLLKNQSQKVYFVW